jgi:hypothetical protein
MCLQGSLFKGEYLGHVMALNEPIVQKGIQEKQRKETVALKLLFWSTECMGVKTRH